MAKGPNPVLRAKRVSGPSARTILNTHVALERCKIAGCNERVLVTKNRTGVDKVRLCATHVAGGDVQERKTVNVRELLAFPWESV